MDVANKMELDNVGKVGNTTNRLRGVRVVMDEAERQILTAVVNEAMQKVNEGNHEEGGNILEKGLRQIEERLGWENPSTLLCAYRLTLVLQDQGQFQKAEAILKDVLHTSRKVFGEGHRFTSVMADSLTVMLGHQGRYREAEEIDRETVAKSWETLTEGHPDALARAFHLAVMLGHQSRYTEAEEIYREVLTASRKVLGEEHYNILVNANHLAIVLRRQGKYHEAEQLHREALKISKKILGEGHVDTLNTTNYLAVVLQLQGKYNEAEHIDRATFQTSRKVLGEDHPTTRAAVSNLALVLQLKGRHREAEGWQRHALEQSERIVGMDDPETLSCLHSLALNLRDQMRYEEAEPLNRKALSGFEKTLGVEHPSTLTSGANLASLLRLQGNIAEADILIRRALSSSMHILGQQRKDKSIFRQLASEMERELALVLQAQGIVEEVEFLSRMTEHPQSPSVARGKGVHELQSGYLNEKEKDDNISMLPRIESLYMSTTTTGNLARIAGEMTIGKTLLPPSSPESQMSEPLPASDANGHNLRGSSQSSDEPDMTEIPVVEDSELGDELASEDDNLDMAMLEDRGSIGDSLRNRILKPVQYFDDLRALKHAVWAGSTLRLYEKKLNSRKTSRKLDFSDLMVRCPAFTPGLWQVPPEYAQDIDVIMVARRETEKDRRSDGLHPQTATSAQPTYAECLCSVLESRNIILIAYANLMRLQRDRYCSYDFNMLAVDPDRNHVARLIRISIADLELLTIAVEMILRRLMISAARFRASPSPQNFVQSLWDEGDLPSPIKRCQMMLYSFGLLRDKRLEWKSCPDCSQFLKALRMTVSTLDLAVVSYAGAHVDRFDTEFLGEDIEVIDVLAPSDGLPENGTLSIELRRFPLRCLDGFHNKNPVWMFSSNAWDIPEGGLFLSATVDEFAGIWGPLWKVGDPNRSKFLPKAWTRYAVGNGSIYRWPKTESSPVLSGNEVLCHWISDEELEQVLNAELGQSHTLTQAEQEMLQARASCSAPSLNFNGTETMLIGAVVAGCERLSVNEHCEVNVAEVKMQLKDSRQLRMLGAVKEHLHRAAETYELQVGYGGVNATATRQYKRFGQSWKKSFVEFWQTCPSLRGPEFLEEFCGIEVSLCTYNAQRVQLARVLGFKFMRRFLENLQWTDAVCKESYFEALRQFEFGRKNTLRDLWEKYPEHQKEFGEAIMLSLKILEKTGVNHKNDLDVFLSSEVTGKPEVATLTSKNHSWIGLLKDNEQSCCMAAFGDECLEMKYENSGSCGESGRTVLRTALVINRGDTPKGIARKHPY